MDMKARIILLARHPIAAALAAAVIASATANAGTLTTLYTFKGGVDGKYPSPLVYHGGKLYGTDYYGAEDNGNVFKVDAATGAFKVVYAFKGGADGGIPETGLIYQDGTLFGTTIEGGTGGGTIFSVNAETNQEIAYPLSNFAGLIGLTYLAGTIYGLAESGGANGDGGIFTFNPTKGSLAPLYSFSGPDGKTPTGQLLYENGLLYGTTTYGGQGVCHLGGCGTLFAINPQTAAEVVVHSFGSKNGKYPYSNIAYHSGSFIADTEVGGNQACQRGCGVSYKVKAATGHEIVLDDFQSQGESYSGITVVGDNAYETLPAGGNGGYGALVEFSLKSGEQAVIYSFTGGADGSDPIAPLTYHNGAFYGSTWGVDGTIFKFVP